MVMTLPITRESAAGPGMTHLGAGVRHGRKTSSTITRAAGLLIGDLSQFFP